MGPVLPLCSGGHTISWPRAGLWCLAGPLRGCCFVGHGVDPVTLSPTTNAHWRHPFLFTTGGRNLTAVLGAAKKMCLEIVVVSRGQ